MTIPIINLIPQKRPPLVRYGFAVVIVAITLVLRLTMAQYLGESRYLSFMIPIVLSSWFGGFGPGLLATGVAALAIELYVTTTGIFRIEGWIPIVLFCIEGTIVSYLFESVKVSGQRLGGIVHSISDGFIVFDREWRVLYANKRAAEIGGILPGQLIGRSIWECFPELEGTEFWQNIHQAMQEQRYINFEYYSVQQQRWFEHSAYPLAEGLTLVTRDVTDRKRRREQLEAAKAQIERMNTQLEQRVEERTAELNATIRELEAFSYSVSHDLRAPLRAIDGFSKMLDEDYQSKLDSEGRRILDVIRNSTVKMGHLVDGLLAFSRLGRQPMGSTEVDMTELARDAFSEVLGPDSNRHVQFSVHELPHAHGDLVLLRQVFVNLLSNALKFTRDRDPAIIEVGSKVEVNQNVFYVKDNGVGFDMRYADKLFGVFQRLHAVTEFEGTGLGLAIVQRIVHRHGGRVWAEGAVGHGATLYFSLPIVKSQVARRSA